MDNGIALATARLTTTAAASTTANAAHIGPNSFEWGVTAATSVAVPASAQY